MSIKEKAQQIIQQVEAEKVAELRRRERERLQLAQEVEESIRQREVFESAILKNGRKFFDSLGIQGVMTDVLGVLKEEDPEVELRLRKSSIRRYFVTRSVFKGGSFEALSETETVGLFAEKKRGDREITTRLGVEVEIGDPSKIWVTAAEEISRFQVEKDMNENLLLVNDPELLEKVESCLARHIVLGHHTIYNYPGPPDDSNLSGGWTGASF